MREASCDRRVANSIKLRPDAYERLTILQEVGQALCKSFVAISKDFTKNSIGIALFVCAIDLAKRFLVARLTRCSDA